MKKQTPEEWLQIFEPELHAPMKLFRAPGRVNLIGEHTDYNDGFVLPSAIGFYTHIAVSPRSDGKLVLRSTEFPQKFEFLAANLPSQKLGEWCDYVLGVAMQLAKAGIALGGADLLVRGEVPVGSGLSSSASLEVASALALLSLSGKTLPLKEIAKLCQRSENEFVGARVGIMDQFVSCHGKAGHAVLLDCRSLDYDLVPIPEQVQFVICNTMVKHELSGGEYNVRRSQCEEGVRILSESNPKIRALRDVTVRELEGSRSEMPEVVFRRCLHVVKENQRVLETKKFFENGDLSSLGKLMLDSHESLRDLYEVSCRELDAMVEAAKGLPGWIGGRMTGGGFGGCTVNLVEREQAKAFASAVASRYQKETGIRPDIYVCSAADGAGAEAATAG
ncbi:MAG TPA: galactokinase [Terriglobales bacterium]|nr:galactokinase [Terriglobales bacterium]